MKVLKKGKYNGEFTIKCLACGCKYKVFGPFEFIFSKERDEDDIYANDTAIYTTHYASTKCPECLYIQRYAGD